MFWNFLTVQLFRSLSISKCIRLGKEIGHQFIMITHSFPFQVNRLLTFYNANKITRDDPSLMD